MKLRAALAVAGLWLLAMGSPLHAQTLWIGGICGSSNPYSPCVFDGQQWVNFGTLNKSTHTYTLPSSQISGVIPPALIPPPSAITLGGVFSATAASNNFVTGIDTTGAPIFARPSFSNLSDSIAASQLIAPTAVSLGAVFSASAATHQFQTGIATSGAPTFAQPAIADISGAGTMAQQNASSVAITGGTITGLPAPTVASDAATKQYVDSTSSGLVVLANVIAATTGTLPTNTYSNGTAGVGATLTATANGALTVDGVSVTSSQRVLVKNEAAPAHNGIYTVTQAGTGSLPYILTRATDFNQSSNIVEGSYTLDTGGSTNAGSGFIMTTSGSVTVGTTGIVWTQFSSGTSYVAGAGLTLAGTTFSLTSPITSAAWNGTAVGSQYGGTGQNYSASSGVLKFTTGTASLVAAPAGAIVGTTDTQTLTNKSIAGSEINSGTIGASFLPSFGSAAAGIVPLSGGGTTNFLRADGSWASPPGSGLAAISAYSFLANLGSSSAVPTAAAIARAPVVSGTTGALELSPSGTLTAGQPYSIDVTAPPYNAKCDGATDDGAAFGAAIQALAVNQHTTTAGGRLVGCAGKIAFITTSINATGLSPTGQQTPISIDMGGALLECVTSGTVCFDMTGDNYVHVNDLRILGAGGGGPFESSIGLQVADPTDTNSSAHENTFTNLSVTGFFTKAPIYLESAEANIFNSCYVSSNDAGAVAAIVEDGYNHFTATSAYYTITRTTDLAKTFAVNTFNCGGVQATTSPALWIGGAYQHRFNIYASTDGPTAIMLYQDGSTLNANLSFDLHLETLPGLLQDFLITGPNANPVIPSLTFTDGIDEAKNYIFKKDTGITSVTMPDLNVHISQFNNSTGVPPVVFDVPSAYTASGYIYVPTTAWWSGAPASYAGTLQVGTAAPQIWGGAVNNPMTVVGGGGYTSLQWQAGQTITAGSSSDPSMYISTKTGGALQMRVGATAIATFSGALTSGVVQADSGNNIFTGNVPAANLPLFTSSANGAVAASGGGTANYLRADGSWAAPSGGGGGLNAIQSFCASGCTHTSGTYTPTAGTSKVYVVAVGAGGAGGCAASSGGSTAAAGSGGGAGEVTQAFITTGFSGVTVTAGAAGAACSAGNNAGGTGATSSFGSALTAVGGTGGMGSAATATLGPNPGGLGGTGGTGSNPPGNPGPRGGYGLDGGAVYAMGGPGGSNAYGAGAGINVVFGATQGAGAAGAGHGSGGSGGASVGGGTSTTGGAGAPGEVIVYEYQ